MKRVGLTGGIATGKSTVARMVQARGVPVVDADQAARAVVAPGQPALQALVEAFGPDILDEGGHLDRARMRARIASDPHARATVERILHPAIRRWIADRLAAHAAEGAEIAVVEAALLVETGSYRDYDALIVVSCDPETQVRRVMARDGVSRAEAEALIATQLPMADKEAVATFVIRNDGDLDDLAAQVDRVWSQLAG